MQRLLSLAANLTVIVIACFVTGCSSKGDQPATPNFGPEGSLYVLNQQDGTLYIYDSKSLVRVDSIPAQIPAPHHLEFSPDHSNYYVVSRNTPGEFAKFTSSPNAFVTKATLNAGTLPTAIAVTLNGLYGYIADFTDKNTDGKIIKYNLGTMAAVPINLQTGRGTHDIKITHDGTRVIACNRFTDDITIVNVADDSVNRVSLNEADPSLPGKPKYGPYGIAITPTDSLAYIACLDSNSHQVRVFDIARDSVVDSIVIPVTPTGNPSLPAGPCLMALSPDNQVLWITTYWGNSVVAVNPITKQVLAEIPFATGLAFGVSLSDDNSRAYVACANAPGTSGMVYIINAATFAKIDSLTVGRNSYMVHYHPVHPH